MPVQHSSALSNLRKRLLRLVTFRVFLVDRIGWPKSIHQFTRNGTKETSVKVIGRRYTSRPDGMIRITEKDGAITFTVRVAPRASRSKIAGEHDGALRARVAAPPVGGAANEELIRTLARALNLPLSAVEIISGHASKTKRVRVHGVRRTALEKLS